MPQENSNIKERSRHDVGGPRKYSVVFHNDDFTPMDFVIAILVNIFFKDIEEATLLMLKAHREGSAIVGTYSYDIATTKAAMSTKIAREQGFPLRISIQ